MKGEKLIMIEWVDISTISGWTDAETLNKTLQSDDADRFFTIGFLLEETKTLIRVAQTICYDENNKIARYADITKIYKGVIKNIKHIK
jgi:hypothetical protein